MLVTRKKKLSKIFHRLCPVNLVLPKLLHLEQPEDVVVIKMLKNHSILLYLKKLLPISILMKKNVLNQQLFKSLVEKGVTNPLKADQLLMMMKWLR